MNNEKKSSSGGIIFGVIIAIIAIIIVAGAMSGSSNGTSSRSHKCSYDYDKVTGEYHEMTCDDDYEYDYLNDDYGDKWDDYDPGDSDYYDYDY